MGADELGKNDLDERRRFREKWLGLLERYGRKSRSLGGNTRLDVVFGTATLLTFLPFEDLREAARDRGATREVLATIRNIAVTGKVHLPTIDDVPFLEAASTYLYLCEWTARSTGGRHLLDIPHAALQAVRAQLETVLLAEVEREDVAPAV